METSAREFMTSACTTSPERAAAFWTCYFAQTKHAIEASKQHELCSALQFGANSSELVHALRMTSLLAARLASLLDFGRVCGFDLPPLAEQAQSAAGALSVSRFNVARELEESLLPVAVQAKPTSS